MILWTNDKFGEHHIDQLREEIKDEMMVKPLSSEIDSVMASAEILVASGPALASLNEHSFNKLINLKWVHILNAGVDMLPFDILDKKKLIVTNSRGAHVTQISEQIVGMMISFSRGLHHHLRNQLNSRWETEYPYEELYGKTLCIIGSGSIGRQLARRAKAFDMKIIGLKNQAVELENFDAVMNIGNLHECLRMSDYVVSLAPLTPHTYHLIGEAEFSVMKKTAVFLNFSRGDIVDENALIHALRNRSIKGAGIDVFHEEPLPPGNELWNMDNVLISPHSSGFIPNLEEKLSHLFKQLYYAYRKGEKMSNIVDLHKKY